MLFITKMDPLRSSPTVASALYTGPFYVDGLSVTVRTVRNDYFDSAVTAFSFRRQPASIADGINVSGGRSQPTAELNDSAFSSDGLAFTLQHTTDGKVKAMVTPAGSPSTFFMRVKVK